MRPINLFGALAQGNNAEQATAEAAARLASKVNHHVCTDVASEESEELLRELLTREQFGNIYDAGHCELNEQYHAYVAKKGYDLNQECHAYLAKGVKSKRRDKANSMRIQDAPNMVMAWVLGQCDAGMLFSNTECSEFEDLEQQRRNAKEEEPCKYRIHGKECNIVDTEECIQRGHRVFNTACVVCSRAVGRAMKHVSTSAVRLGALEIDLVQLNAAS